MARSRLISQLKYFSRPLLMFILLLSAVNSSLAFSKSKQQEITNIFEPIQTQNNNHAPITTSLVPIHYVKAKLFEKFIQEKSGNLLSKDGMIKAEEQTNTLLIRDDPNHVDQIKSLIKKLDMPAKQVLIQARIVNIDRQSLKSLGIEFLHPSNNMSHSEFILDLPFTREKESSSSHIHLVNDRLLDLKLTALEKTGHAKIASKPELITLNRKSASIESGEEIPYQEQTSSGGTSTTFKKAALSLTVTPQILPNQKIKLNLVVNQDKVNRINTKGTPAIRTQQIKTEVIVKNRQAIALGGIFEESKERSVNKIPFLNKIPLLGAIFKQKSSHVQQRELLIFIKPVII